MRACGKLRIGKLNFDKSVYIDASVVSDLTAGAFSNPSNIARHHASAGWLDFWGPRFELYTSAPAIEGTDRERRRDGELPEALEGVTKLPITNAVNALADALISEETLTPASGATPSLSTWQPCMASTTC